MEAHPFLSTGEDDVEEVAEGQASLRKLGIMDRICQNRLQNTGGYTLQNGTYSLRSCSSSSDFRSGQGVVLY